jgi:deoxycytidine triphosphate deaminase
MSVLGHDQIKNRSDEIFSANYDPNQVQPAAYELRPSNTEAKIGDTVYTMNEEALHEGENTEQNALLKLPARRISVISTKEKLSIPDDLCARIGIRLKYSRQGLISMFGPQIDPGYDGRFYAVIYNASGEPVEIPQNEAVFKMEIQQVEGSKINDVHRSSIEHITDLNLEDLDDGITDLTDVRDELRGDTNKTIEEVWNEVNDAQNTIKEIKGGYRQIVLFGVFLLATSVFGVVYSIIFTSVQESGFQLGINYGTIFTGLFLVGWLLAIVMLLWRSRRSQF